MIVSKWAMYAAVRKANESHDRHKIVPDKDCIWCRIDNIIMDALATPVSGMAKRGRN